tara:strand:+ start:116 stop:562 length:447 start_codon:yes stop_codon:yes gene_type:complete
MAIHKVDGVDGDNNFPKKFVTLYCTGAVTKGDWVQIETDTGVTGYAENGLGASVTKADAVANGNMAVIGVATETKTAAGNLQIQTAGKFVDASVANAVAAGDALVVDDTSAGQAVKMANSDLPGPCGLALEAPSGNLGDVLIIDQGYF